MQAGEILSRLKAFLASEVLADRGTALDEQTPLLEWGIIDSMSMLHLLSFIQQSLHIDIPDELVRPDNFTTLRRITDMLVRLQAEAAGNPCTAESEVVIAALERSGIERVRLRHRQGVQHLLHAPGTGPPWVLLPGLAMHSYSWGEVLIALRPTQEAIALDLAGCGLSTSTKVDVSVDDHVEMVLQTIDQLFHEPVVLVGCSLGGWIATEVARRQPSRLRALVLAEWGLIDNPATWWKDLMSLSNNLERLLERSYSRAPLLTPTLRANLESRFALAAFRHFADGEALGRLSLGFDGVSTPTLFVVGEQDGIVPPAAVERAARSLPGARVERLARCGHLPLIEQPKELVRVIRSFLESLKRLQ